MGAHRLPRFGLRPSSGTTGPPAAWVRATAAALEVEADRIASLPAGRTVPARRPVPQPGDYPPASLSVDLEVWMTSLGHQLARIEHSLTPPSRSGAVKL
ncbi:MULTISPECIES: hypothetical protein [unclassified Streptomyces]|uniref:hypothetical protein n=1 Tax=unclassified Streptomyces TaxID=2593676 RepID=UPI00386B3520